MRSMIRLSGRAMCMHGKDLARAAAARCMQVWDNNHHRDFHSRASTGKDQATLEEEAYRQLLSQALDSDTEAAQRAGAPLAACMSLSVRAAARTHAAESARGAARKAGERVELRAEAQRKRRQMQRKVLYTNPLVPRAGEPCEVYYNPDMTALRGRPEVYMRGSWNRWTHPNGIPTTKLDAAFTCGIGFLKARTRSCDCTCAGCVSKGGAAGLAAHAHACMHVLHACEQGVRAGDGAGAGGRAGGRLCVPRLRERADRVLRQQQRSGLPRAGRRRAGHAAAAAHCACER
jgi:hypothetical protein